MSGERIWPVACSTTNGHRPARRSLHMARQGKALPARRTRPALDDSLLLRSAESLGRVIGSLQRQLDGASKKVSAGTEGVAAAFRMNGSGAGTQPGRAGKSAGKNTATRTTKKTAAKAAGA